MLDLSPCRGGFPIALQYWNQKWDLLVYYPLYSLFLLFWKFQDREDWLPRYCMEHPAVLVLVFFSLQIGGPIPWNRFVYKSLRLPSQDSFRYESLLFSRCLGIPRLVVAK